jgi:hypothetical protein
MMREVFNNTSQHNVSSKTILTICHACFGEYLNASFIVNLPVEGFSSSFGNIANIHKLVLLVKFTKIYICLKTAA